MSRTHLLMICAALCAVTAACDRRTAVPARHPDADIPPDVAMIEDSCPVHVPATTVTVVNTKDGVAMFFTTTPGNVAEVRRRVAAIARMDLAADTSSGTDATARPSMDLPPWLSGAQPTLVPLRTLSEDVPDGGSLVLTPINPMDLEQLRAYALSHAYRMRLGRCEADFMKAPHRTESQNADLPSGTLG